MASPLFVAEPRKQATPGAGTGTPAADKVLGLLWAVGGLLFMVLAVSHPQGNAPATVLGFGAWTTVHVLGAMGVGLIVMAALYQLVTRIQPNRIITVGLAAVVVFGAILVVAVAVDGFLSPTIAALAGTAEGQAAYTGLIALERAIAAFGYGGFGLAGALVTVGHLGRAGWPMRVVGALVTLVFLLLASAGIVYIGLGVDALAPAFAAAPLVAAWFIVLGVRELSRRRSPAAASARSTAATAE